MRGAKERRDAFYDQTSEQKIVNRDAVRQRSQALAEPSAGVD